MENYAGKNEVTISPVTPISSQLNMLSQVSKRALSARAFSTTRVALLGPTGNDAFAEREKGQESAYIRKHEAEQLAQLKEELAKQKESIEKLEEQLSKK